MLARGFSPEAGELHFENGGRFVEWKATAELQRVASVASVVCLLLLQDAWEHIAPVYGTPDKDPKASFFCCTDIFKVDSHGFSYALHGTYMVMSNHSCVAE